MSAITSEDRILAIAPNVLTDLDDGKMTLYWDLIDVSIGWDAADYEDRLITRSDDLGDILTEFARIGASYGTEPGTEGEGLREGTSQPGESA